jgi:hypothetical protein
MSDEREEMGCLLCEHCGPVIKICDTKEGPLELGTALKRVVGKSRGFILSCGHRHMGVLVSRQEWLRLPSGEIVRGEGLPIQD